MEMGAAAPPPLIAPVVTDVEEEAAEVRDEIDGEQPPNEEEAADDEEDEAEEKVAPTRAGCARTVTPPPTAPRWSTAVIRWKISDFIYHLFLSIFSYTPILGLYYYPNNCIVSL